MGKNKEFIIKIDLDRGREKDKKEEIEKDKIKKVFKREVLEKEKIVEGSKNERLQFSLKDWGGYTPAQLLSKLEETKNAIAKGNAQEALMNLNNCIIRISGRALPEEKSSDAGTGYQYQLDQVLPDPGK